MPLGSFVGCHERVARAEAHTRAFGKAWSEFLEDDPCDTHLEIDSEGTGTLSVVRRYERLPAVFSLELGEILYQLRAALDGAIYACAIEETGQDPRPNAGDLEFPICDTEPEIECSSPHRVLSILNDWARKDRHRTLHVVASWGSETQPLVVAPPATLAYITVTYEGFLERNCEVAAFKVGGYTRGMDIKANPNMSIDVAVDEDPPPCVHTDTLGSRLKAMRIEVGAVLRALETSCLKLSRDGRAR